MEAQHNSDITENAIGHWVLVHERLGQGVSTLQVNGTLYQPEQDVLAFGVFGTAYTFDPAQSPQGPSTVMWSGTSHAMRRFQTGDQLILIAHSDTLLGQRLTSVIQAFFKF